VRKAKRRSEVTIEIDQLFVSRRHDQASLEWCPVCGSEVSMTIPEEAAAYLQVSVRSIFRLIESGQVHFADLSGRALRVCLSCVRNGSSAAPSRPWTSD
jgi:excisionase family DNA binding protein